MSKDIRSAISVADFGFDRLPRFYSSDLLARSKVVEVSRVPVPPLGALGLPEFKNMQLEKVFFEKGSGLWTT
jgi:hypothetical protein